MAYMTSARRAKGGRYFGMGRGDRRLSSDSVRALTDAMRRQNPSVAEAYEVYRRDWETYRRSVLAPQGKGSGERKATWTLRK